MSRVWRWVLRAIGALAGLVLLVLVAGLVMGMQREGRTMQVAVQPVAIPTDAAALERGAYLYRSRGCADCHGANGAGRTLVDDGSTVIAGPHIGNGPGSLTARYKPEDWVRSIRHGVSPDGRPLRVMPSEDYNRLTDADLGAIVAHLRQLPSAPGGAGTVRLPLPARVLYGFGLIPDAADKIDHRLPPQAPVPEGDTVEHGRYVAQMCIGCHGPGYSGGRIPGGPPDWPAAANISPGDGTAMVRYADAAAFARMMRSGKRPDGSAIAVMPFEALRAMNDTDLNAMYRYLNTLPPKATGTR